MKAFVIDNTINTLQLITHLIIIRVFIVSSRFGSLLNPLIFKFIQKRRRVYVRSLPEGLKLFPVSNIAECDTNNNYN